MVLSCSKKLSALLREILPKHVGGFYCLNFLHSHRTKNKLESHKNVCENKDFCGVAMLSEDTKTPSIIYADLQSLTERINGCKNNFENPSIVKVD